MTDKNASAIVAAARSDQKITTKELIQQLFPDFIELHGDHLGTDDPAIIGGLASFNNQPVTVIATDRGKTVEKRMATHFGCPTPGGYRKALRLAKQAAKFHRPILFFVNTPGAYPGKSAEENGQGAAIADNLLQIAQLPTPIITVIFGEGGSGGALALACGDAVWMLANSTYSILSPEGFASILWKDSRRAGEAAEIMQLTPTSLLKKQVIEGIIAEPADHQQVTENISAVLTRELTRLEQYSPEELMNKRHQRYRKF
ncbi:acetyl-CoA carboxylase carboxyltransferase subunit alpha [Limosilactobacillus galli]|uniref:acetyl-CoA carboxylase carboxyltransferase subunit alpha n=1 Tax=Limosilactobacillus galli TaxID=2991834 RepID=UPI0024BA7DD8|nr:carboxyltransferase subunit alpha [Limosilactobacillus galli]